MDEAREPLGQSLVVRADADAFRAEVGRMRAELTGPLVDGAEIAGRAIERALLRSVASGKLGLGDLRQVALSVLADIARAAVAAGMQALGGAGGAAGGGAGGGGSTLTQLALAVAGALGGAPGRAIGGPVAPGRPYRVGERGPEWFVPTSAGRVLAAGDGTGGGGGGSGGGGGTMSIIVNLNGIAGADAAARERLQASGRQVARAVRRAIEGAA